MSPTEKARFDRELRNVGGVAVVNGWAASLLLKPRQRKASRDDLAWHEAAHATVACALAARRGQP